MTSSAAARSLADDTRRPWPRGLGWAWAGAAVLVGLAGCVNTGVTDVTSGLYERFRHFQGPAGADVVTIDTALVERPAGDRYLNVGLWESADEQAIPADEKAPLEANGFRVATVGGITPDGLHRLLTSDRSCGHARRLQLHAGSPTSVRLGPDLASCTFRLEGREADTTLNDVTCTVSVTASLPGGDRVGLHCTPILEHGATTRAHVPAIDRTGWATEEQRPAERYDSLGWDVALLPNDYLVVGTSFGRTGTLGHECLVRLREPKPVQRLLVIRVARRQNVDDLGRFEDDGGGTLATPLALQAGRSVVRGSSR